MEKRFQFFLLGLSHGTFGLLVASPAHAIGGSRAPFYTNSAPLPVSKCRAPALNIAMDARKELDEEERALKEAIEALKKPSESGSESSEYGSELRSETLRSRDRLSLDCCAAVSRFASNL